MRNAGAEQFDYIVVGAGAAGCVVASRLAAAAAAGPRRTVLLVEYGGRDLDPLIHIPKGFYYTLRGQRYLYRYPTDPAAPGQRPETWLRGKVVGGSTAVNGMMWTRGAPADWDGLAARGNQGWAWADILPAYRALEDHSLGASGARGAGGPVGVTITPATGEISAAILQAAQNYGWAHVDDINSYDTERIGYTPCTIKNGRRVSAYSAMVRSGENNLVIATRTRAERVLFDGRRATGIRVRYGSGGAGEVAARREVIIAAGAVETPLLLERSGIGSPGVLRALGIAPLVESPNVGERLIEQRGVALQVTLRHGPARHLAREIFRYLLNGQGLLATAGYDLVCQFKSSPGISRPDIQGLFVPMALDTGSTEMRLAKHPGILFMGYPIRPRTFSSVHASGASAAGPPVIRPRFLATEADRAAIAPVLGIARGVLGEGPLADLIEAEEFPGPSVGTPAEVVQYSLATGTGVYHAVGSAAMGPSGDDVVDDRLRVRGTEGLRIADASVLPVQVAGNTAAPAMAVGWRAADFILEDAVGG
ncbi:MAG TPA: GMC family oxidoreductase [Trebonia sp.]|jgi:choline dehydrogenase-like flavoprotein|nr:GMC family oxidoreductase [Trebonia sp.]